MKKFFTLFSAAVLTVAGASAAKALPRIANAKADPVKLAAAQERFEKRIPAILAGEDNENEFYTRSYTDATGKVWNYKFMLEGLCFDQTALTDTVKYPEYKNLTDQEKLEMIPLYDVMCVITCYTNNSDGSIGQNSMAYMSLAWPTYAYFNNDPAKGLEIVPPSVFCERLDCFDDNGKPAGYKTTNRFEKNADLRFAPADETTGEVYSYLLNLASLSKSGVVATVNGVDVLYSGTGFPITDGSSMVFNSCEEDDGEEIFNISTNITFMGTNGNFPMVTMYNGAIQHALVPQNYKVNLTTACLFYEGDGFDNEQDEDEFQRYFGEWGPFSKYYFGLGNQAAIVKPDQTKESGPFSIADIHNYRYRGTMPFDMGYFRGGFFAANGAAVEKPEFDLTFATPTERKLSDGAIKYLLTPEVNKMVPFQSKWVNEGWCAYNNNAVNDGFYCAWQGFKPNIELSSRLVFGSTDGVVLMLKDTDGNTYTGVYTGSVAYAKNPANMYDFTEVSSYGNIKIDWSGVETIGDENVNAPVKYYNMQGMEIANPAKGQLVIKKQGKKATKVIM